MALEVTLAAGLAVQAARLAWTLVTPLGPFGEPPRMQASARTPADLSILAQFDPFFRVEAGAPTTAGEGSSGAGPAVLHGVRAGPGGRGSAILSIGGGPQRSVTVGEEVEPDLVLLAVARDHVILGRGGGRQRVGFPTPQSSPATSPSATAGFAPAPAAPPVSSNDGPSLDPRRLLGQTSLVPRLRGGQPAGYTVYPRGGSDVLRQAGLQQGDVLLSVDGVALTPERVSELPQSLAASTSAEIRFERGGQIMTARIGMAAQ
jgi:general secretion pathway protein C